MIISRARPVAAAVVLVVAAGILSACASSSATSSVPAKGVGSSVPISAPAGPSSGAPSSSAPASSPAVTGSPVTPGDFTSATYTTPTGLQPSNAFTPAVPLETAYKSYFLVPTSAPTGGNVIGIYIYTLPANKAVDATTDIPARISAYNTMVKARVTNPVSPFSTPNLSGYRNYREGVVQPPNFTYLAYFSFGAHHVMEFTCQYTGTTQVATFAVSCGKVLGTIRLS